MPSTRSAASPYPAAQGLALHGSTLFVADSGNGRVAVWEATPRLRYSRSIGGKGCAAGQLLRPSGLALAATLSPGGRGSIGGGFCGRGEQDSARVRVRNTY